jgi:hypothetical protein
LHQHYDDIANFEMGILAKLLGQMVSSIWMIKDCHQMFLKF